MNINNNKLIVGLTGGIASGKTTVANYLSSMGAHLIDTDIIAREVVAPNTTINKQIRKLLGDDYFLDDGNINRSAIRELIFNDDDYKKQYENIILPAIRLHTLQAINDTPVDYYTLLIVPLLFEKGLHDYTNYNISIDITTDIQTKRSISRGINSKTISNIIASQMPHKIRNNLADYVIDNTKSIEMLYQQLDKIHLMLCKLAQKKQT